MIYNLQRFKNTKCQRLSYSNSCCLHWKKTTSICYIINLQVFVTSWIHNYLLRHKSIIFCNRKYHQRIYGIRLHFYIFLSALHFGIYLWTWFYQNVQNIFINYVNFEQQRNTATRFTFSPSFSSPRSLIHSLLRSLMSASWRYVGGSPEC